MNLGSIDFFVTIHSISSYKNYLICQQRSIRLLYISYTLSRLKYEKGKRILHMVHGGQMANQQKSDTTYNILEITYVISNYILRNIEK